MLHLPSKRYINFPHLSLRSNSKVAFSPIPISEDELTKAIEYELQNTDDNWELTERPNAEELERFWDHVEEDVHNDPDWIDFSRET